MTRLFVALGLPTDAANALVAIQPSVAVIDEFLQRNADFSLLEIHITEFGLYSSEFVGNAPVYQREDLFPLSS